LRYSAKLTSLELRNDDMTLPSQSTLGLASPGILANYPEYADAGHARCRIAFDAQLARSYPWLRLHATFAGGEELPISFIHLVENEHVDIAAPFISPVYYENNRFRFYVENAGAAGRGKIDRHGRARHCGGGHAGELQPSVELSRGSRLPD
jgi:hypothetical protein